MTLTADREFVRRAIDDVGFFAEACVREPLWPHQLDAARSPARIRVLRAGRQVGKSRLLAILALHEAFKAPDRHVLILSNGDDNAKDLLAEVLSLANASPLLAGAIEDDLTSRVILSNGSWIRSIPASPKQARGKSIDLLIIDEACWVSEEVWSAAKYSQAARPGSRLLLASSPYGKRDKFFAVHDALGLGGLTDVAGVTVETFVWPSTVSPLVREAGLVEFWRRTDPPRMFAAEVLAEWQSDAGAYFSAEEIDACVADYELRPPSEGRGDQCVGGVDLGYRTDQNALVLLGIMDDGDLNPGMSESLVFVPWLESHHRMLYPEFADRLVDACDREAGGYGVEGYVVEANGPGEPFIQGLKIAKDRRPGTWRTGVYAAWTDNRRKESGFGQLKLWMQNRRLVLPRSSTLLRELHALQYETTDSGMTKISVPEAGGGHDDVVMALLQAASAMRASAPRPVLGGERWLPPYQRSSATAAGVLGETTTTPGGVVVPVHPRCVEMRMAYQTPRSEKRDDGW